MTEIVIHKTRLICEHSSLTIRSFTTLVVHYDLRGGSGGLVVEFCVSIVRFQFLPSNCVMFLIRYSLYAV
jgi:hypothetical protein